MRTRPLLLYFSLFVSDLFCSKGSKISSPQPFKTQTRRKRKILLKSKVYSSSGTYSFFPFSLIPLSKTLDFVRFPFPRFSLVLNVWPFHSIHRCSFVLKSSSSSSSFSVPLFRFSAFASNQWLRRISDVWI